MLSPIQCSLRTCEVAALDVEKLQRTINRDIKRDTLARQITHRGVCAQAAVLNNTLSALKAPAAH